MNKYIKYASGADRQPRFPGVNKYTRRDKFKILPISKADLIHQLSMSVSAMAGYISRITAAINDSSITHILSQVPSYSNEPHICIRPMYGDSASVIDTRTRLLPLLYKAIDANNMALASIDDAQFGTGIYIVCQAYSKDNPISHVYRHDDEIIITHCNIIDGCDCDKCGKSVDRSTIESHQRGWHCSIDSKIVEATNQNYNLIANADIAAEIRSIPNIPSMLVPERFNVWAPTWVLEAVDSYIKYAAENGEGFAGLTLSEFLTRTAAGVQPSLDEPLNEPPSGTDHA